MFQLYYYKLIAQIILAVLIGNTGLFWYFLIILKHKPNRK